MAAMASHAANPERASRVIIIAEKERGISTFGTKALALAHFCIAIWIGQKLWWCQLLFH